MHLLSNCFNMCDTVYLTCVSALWAGWGTLGVALWEGLGTLGQFKNGKEMYFSSTFSTANKSKTYVYIKKMELLFENRLKNRLFF